ncbi:MAG: ANTAR domain-containing protein [Anaerolineae bacterium]|nr:ANTAR domain-containing protein [Anaerolineae bacterium]
MVNTAVVREMHHRVKNNLQTIAMLLRLQLGEGDRIDAGEELHESINRILSIAAVHEVLSEKGFRLADVKQILTHVAQTVTQNRLHPHKDLRVEVRGDEITLPSRSATALTLLIKPVDERELLATLEVVTARFAEQQQSLQQTADLEERLATRKAVERAKGVLMQREGLSEKEAYRRIQRQSRQERRTKRRVAEVVLRQVRD